MTSNAATVDEYLGEVPTERLEAMTRIRALILETHDGYEESMAYGMPSYSKDGVVEVAMNLQRQAISLYLLKAGVLDQFRDEFPKSAVGKGCVRYRNPGTIDFELMATMLRVHHESDEKPC